jgi:hypothetical protein
MTTELQMMATPMVEDCADEREARDEALIRVEQLKDRPKCQTLGNKPSSTLAGGAAVRNDHRVGDDGHSESET